MLKFTQKKNRILGEISEKFRNVQIGPGGTETDAWMDLEAVLVSVLIRTFGCGGVGGGAAW